MKKSIVLFTLILGCGGPEMKHIPTFDEVNCSRPVSPLPEAQAYIWSFYGGTGAYPRAIFAGYGSECLPEYLEAYGTCAVGYAMPACNSFVYEQWGASLGESSLSHEMFHLYLSETTGDADPDHLGPGWIYEVGAVNLQLIMRGW